MNTSQFMKLIFEQMPDFPMGAAQVVASTPTLRAKFLLLRTLTKYANETPGLDPEDVGDVEVFGNVLSLSFSQEINQRWKEATIATLN